MIFISINNRFLKYKYPLSINHYSKLKINKRSKTRVNLIPSWLLIGKTNISRNLSHFIAHARYIYTRTHTHTDSTAKLWPKVKTKTKQKCDKKNAPWLRSGYRTGRPAGERFPSFWQTSSCACTVVCIENLSTARPLLLLVLLLLLSCSSRRLEREWPGPASRGRLLYGVAPRLLVNTRAH